MGGYLATVTTKEEDEFIYSYLKSKNIKSAYIGLTDQENEGIWNWVTGESVDYTNWHSGDPNSENTGEDYAQYYYKFSEGTWNDAAFVTEQDGYGNYRFIIICEWGDYTA